MREKPHDSIPNINNYNEFNNKKVEPFDITCYSKQEIDNLIDNIDYQLDLLVKTMLIFNAIFFIAITTLAIIIFV